MREMKLKNIYNITNALKIYHGLKPVYDELYFNCNIKTQNIKIYQQKYSLKIKWIFWGVNNNVTENLTDLYQHSYFRKSVLIKAVH